MHNVLELYLIFSEETFEYISKLLRLLFRTVYKVNEYGQIYTSFSGIGLPIGKFRRFGWGLFKAYIREFECEGGIYEVGKTGKEEARTFYTLSPCPDFDKAHLLSGAYRSIKYIARSYVYRSSYFEDMFGKDYAYAEGSALVLSRNLKLISIPIVDKLYLRILEDKLKMSLPEQVTYTIYVTHELRKIYRHPVIEGKLDTSIKLKVIEPIFITYW